jgi:hypothetical protein
MAARSPATGAGAGGTVNAEVAAVVTAAATAASYCDPAATAVPRGGSVVATALPAARGHRRVRPERLNRREGGDGRHHPANGNTRSSSSPSKSGTPGENATYVKLEKPCFLFLEGSAGAVAALVAATTALVDTPAALADASAVRAASSIDCPAADASAPVVGACSSATSTALGDRGGGFHLSRGAPLSLSSSSSSDDDFSVVVGGESPYCSRSQYSLSVRNMVPTLTSRKRRGLSLNGRC